MSELNKFSDDRLKTLELAVPSAAAAAATAQSTANDAAAAASNAGANAQTALSNLSAGILPPNSPAQGNLWVDTSTDSAPVLKIWNGIVWQIFTAV